MSSHLDLEEQEQLDELKHFWKQYGNAITWFLIVVMGAYASWNGYQYWQKLQSAKAAALKWAAESASDEASAQLARLRLANLQIQQKAYEEAAKTLAKPFTPAFAGLASDIQGDLYMAQNKSQEAVKAYTEAWSKLESSNEYRRLIAAKLNALGADPEPTKGASK